MLLAALRQKERSYQYLCVCVFDFGASRSLTMPKKSSKGKQKVEDARIQYLDITDTL